MVGAHQNLNGLRDLEVIPGNGGVDPSTSGYGLSSAGLLLLRSTYLPNLKCHTSKIRKAIQNIETGVVWGS